MKNLMLIAALSLGIGFAKAQKLKEAEVPAAVKESFKKQYPNTKAEGWEKEGANYEVEFDVNKAETSLTFDSSGKLIETEVEIAETALPKAVTDYLTKNMAGKKIKEASKITDAAGKVMYEVEIDKADHLFDENGTPVQKQ